MRILLLLRGAAGCGKSTWIRQNNLKLYTLSPDDIRLLCQSPVMQADGTEAIGQDNENFTWKLLFKLLEMRMQKGEFTVIDATNTETSEINRYKEMSYAYKYRVYCVDFTDIPIEEVKRRNAGREPLKRVPDKVIDRMYSRFATQKIPSGVKVIGPDELNTIWISPLDFSGYKRIHHIGDIHGCNSVLQKYLSDNGGIREDEMYIFAGDYIDRGRENAEVVKFLNSIKNRKNVLMLEGNHERELWLYANGYAGNSKEFELETRPALEEAGISKQEIRLLYRKFGQCAYYKYDNAIYLVTHGGLSTVPENLSFVATDQMIRGVGSFDDFEKIAETFARTTPGNFYQIHGHRNTKSVPVQVNDRVFNLEGHVEFGGELRCVQVDRDGVHIVTVKNEIFKIPNIQRKPPVTESSVADAIIALRSNQYILEKKYGNISSFNFTDKAFYDRVWDEQTIRARGLYLDTVKGRVVARAYDKFFNINENAETRFGMLQYKLQFPVIAYVKENGFLGIVSYNEYEDDLLIACKSTIDSKFARWFREMLHEKVSSESLAGMKEYARKENVSFVFECVDMEHDPHVIEYPGSRLFLLDIIKNDMDFFRYEYDELVETARQFGLTPKEKAYEIANWQDFFDWYYEVLAEDYEYCGRKIEGFVIQDCNGYMTKLKLAYYSFWRFMRGVAHEVIRKGVIKRTSTLTTPTANEFYAWVKRMCDEGKRDSLPKDICTLRKMFYSEEEMR